MINGTVRLLLLKGLCFCPLGTSGQLSGSEHEDSLAMFSHQKLLRIDYEFVFFTGSLYIIM